MNDPLQELIQSNQEMGFYFKCPRCRCQHGCACCKEGFCGCKENYIEIKDDLFCIDPMTTDLSQEEISEELL
jgi:hypothetical protein